VSVNENSCTSMANVYDSIAIYVLGIILIAIVGYKFKKVTKDNQDLAYSNHKKEVNHNKLD
jgi:cbb3-type cytochrome oxidase subunit 3